MALGSSKSFDLQMEEMTKNMILLTPSNYSSWKPRMEDLLLYVSMYDPIKGDEAKPLNISDEEWSFLSRKTVAFIRQWIDVSVFNHVALETNAHSLWKAMENLFGRKTFDKKLIFMTKLVNLRYKDGYNMENHLKDFVEMVYELNYLEIVLPDEVQAYMFLSTLPTKIQGLVDYAQVEKLSMSFVKERLSKANGFVLEGHESSESTKFQDKCETKGANSGGSDGNVKRVEKDTGFLNDSWIFSTRYGFHICSKREWFYTYEVTRGESITLAHGKKLKVEGVGNVKVKLHTGNVITLGNVRYVPEFTSNVVSVGHLTSLGYSVIAGNGVMEVRNGDAVIMIGETTKMNLFELKGHTVGANVTAYVL